VGDMGMGVKIDGLLNLYGASTKRVRFAHPTLYHFGMHDRAYLRNVYNASDIMLVPSHSEGFGIPYCFKAGTQIQTEHGHKSIETIKVGDRVVSGTNNVRVVSELHKNNYKGKFAKIKTALTNITDLDVTDNHAFLALKREGWNRNKSTLRGFLNEKEPKWVRANDLEEGDYLLHPIKKDWNKENITIDLIDIIGGSCTIDVSDNGLLSCRTTNQSRHCLPNNIMITPEFAKLLGYYVAEGNIIGGDNPSGIELSFHINEKQYHKEVITAFNTIGLYPTVTEKKEHNCTVIRVCSKIIATLFESLCGNGCRIVKRRYRNGIRLS